MSALQYLTVQDVLWINLQVTGAPQDFGYADLEEATFYQYGYGQSTSLLPQAARFITGFLKKKPLAAGNEATVFVACLAFLKANGVDLNLADPVDWFRSIESGKHEALDSIEKNVKPSHGHDDHHATPDVPKAMAAVLKEYGDAVGKLSSVVA